MNRRGFIAALIGGAVLDPERLLWRPGKTLISIPAGTMTTRAWLEAELTRRWPRDFGTRRLCLDVFDDPDDNSYRSRIEELRRLQTAELFRT